MKAGVRSLVLERPGLDEILLPIQKSLPSGFDGFNSCETIEPMIYLDHNATTPVLPEVVDAMRPFLQEQFGNPSSAYRLGARAKGAVDGAREQVANLVGALPEEIVFTSGATEANNSAIHAAVMANPFKRHLVTSEVEHSSVLEYCRYLEEHHGYRITYLPVNENGQLPLHELEVAIDDQTALVSLMWANNETGVIFPVSDIAEMCRKRNVLFHCDAVQAVGKVEIGHGDLRPDYLAISGHKLGALKGVGALIVPTETPFIPFIYGGKQEAGKRGGSEAVPLVVGMGASAEVWANRGIDLWKGIEALRNQLEATVLEIIPGGQLNGGKAQRLPNTSNIYLPNIDADALVILLDQAEICISSGSACMESALSPSHVIFAITGSHEVASNSIRISLGIDTTASEIKRFEEQIAQAALVLR